MTHPGGAQLTDRAHFLEGVRRGHDLEIWTPHSEAALDSLGAGDIVLASNPVFIHHEVFLGLLDRGARVVWFLHDYQPLCRWRLFYPMQEECRSCHRKERWLPILLKARLIIWLSPLHRESWLWTCPELAGVPHHLSPSPVNPDRFHDMGLPRQGVVAVESLHPFKGRKHVLRWAQEHPEVPITFLAGNPFPNDGLPPNCRVVDQVPGWRMNEVYNRHQVMLHLPQSPSPFDRAVPEAYLAGCRIVGNSLVGALSWPFFQEGREGVAQALRESPTRFWEAVEGALT